MNQGDEITIVSGNDDTTFGDAPIQHLVIRRGCHPDVQRVNHVHPATDQLDTRAMVYVLVEEEPSRRRIQASFSSR